MGKKKDCAHCGFVAPEEDILDEVTSLDGVPDHLLHLAKDIKSFWAYGTVPRISKPSALLFLREYVSKNVPVIITGVMDNWPAMSLWTDDYLRSHCGESVVTVDITPNGYGDCVTSVGDGNGGAADMFVKPEERKMTFSEFLHIFNSKEFDGVPYLSHQNDCLREEFPNLAQDVVPAIDFATEAFGDAPDAVNIWMGDGRAVSSLHKDYYENMYCVIRGEKHFTLLPPADAAFLKEESYPPGRYHYSADEGQCECEGEGQGQGWVVVPDTGEGDEDGGGGGAAEPVRWIRSEPNFAAPGPRPAVAAAAAAAAAAASTPPLPPAPAASSAASGQTPLQQQQQQEEEQMLRVLASPLHCVVRAGETLYLPSMWHHRVTQRGPTIAVNYWHDMQFDCKHVFYQFVRAATAAAAAEATAPAEEDATGGAAEAATAAAEAAPAPATAPTA